MSIIKQPFYTAAAHLNDMYNIVLEDGQFESIGLHAWDKIGNKDTRLYKYYGTVVDHSVELPCNVQMIEAVYSNYGDFQMTDNIRRENYAANEVEVYIEGRKSNESSLYHRGKLLKYELVGNKLYFNHDCFDTQVMILYKGVFLDEEGLPYLNYKEIEAIADYCAYVTFNKKGMMTKDQATIQLAQMIKQNWLRSCDDARTPTYLSQNDVNDILDVMSSWDRKRFGVSFKPIT